MATPPRPNASEPAGSTSSPEQTVGGTGTAADNINFIQHIINTTLVRQPTSIQAVVLFIFVFLFIYMIIVTTQGSIVLSTQIQVQLSPEDIARQNRQGRILPGQKDQVYGKPPPGYQVRYGDHTYGLNANGGIRIPISMTSYAAALVTRSIDVSIETPMQYEIHRSVPMSGLALGGIFFEAPKEPAETRPNTMGAVDAPWEESGPRAAQPEREFAIVARARAQAKEGARLYLQNITAGPGVSPGNVNATLVAAGQTRSLVTLSSNLTPNSDGTLLVKGGASLVQNYQSYFPLAEPSVPPGAQIKLQASSGLFGTAYNETFELPANLPLGKPTPVYGSFKGTLIVQLAYPIDIVFFERLETPAVTEKLSLRMAALGYATRINLNGATSSGEYNAVYAGRDVPPDAVQAVIKEIAAGGVALRTIRAGISLSNGMQNQIQIGANKVMASCPAIDDQKIGELLKMKPGPDLIASVQALPVRC